jgi:hypothetical protein
VTQHSNGGYTYTEGSGSSSKIPYTSLVLDTVCCLRCIRYMRLFDSCLCSHLLASGSNFSDRNSFRYRHILILILGRALMEFRSFLVLGSLSRPGLSDG